MRRAARLGQVYHHGLGNLQLVAQFSFLPVTPGLGENGGGVGSRNGSARRQVGPGAAIMPPAALDVWLLGIPTEGGKEVSKEGVTSEQE